MNPLQTSPRLGSNASLILMKREGNAQPCVTKKLRMCALAIASLVFLALFSAFTALIVLGVAHFSIVFGLIVSLVLSGVMLTSLYRVCAPCREKLPIPSGFLAVIKQEFPQAIYDLTIQERLTLQELRAVLSGLSSKNCTFPSIGCQEKVERFGLECLQKDCEGIELPDLDKLLLKHCPFYFINRFIQLGPREFPKGENLSPEVYWLCRAGLSASLDTAFHHYIWLVSRVVSQSEYETLLNHAQNATWDQAVAMVEEVRARLIACVPSEAEDCFYVDRVWLSNCFSHFPLKWLLYLCKHGVSWEQLQLMKQVEFKDMVFLSMFNDAHGGMSLVELIVSIYPHIQEDHKAFDPSITLLTWDEWISDYENHKEDPRWNFYDRTISFLNERRGDSLMRKGLPHIPIYSLNSTTGENMFR